MNKDIINKNDKGERHGYQEWYVINGLLLRGNFKNGKRIGYYEVHEYKRTRFYIK